MKRAICILLLCISSVYMSTGQVIFHRSIYNIDGYVRELVYELGISDTSVQIYIMPTDKYCPNSGVMLSKDTTMKVFPVYVSESLPYSDYLKVLTHEFVHVKQLLTHGRPNIKVYSDKYEKVLKYPEKWEDEAHTVGNSLYFKIKVKIQSICIAMK